MKDKQQRKQRQILFVIGGSIILVIAILSIVFLLQQNSGGKVTSIYKDPTYVSPFVDEVAQNLHLSSSQLKSQAIAGKSMVDIAAAQGISAAQLHTIELNAFQHLFDKGVQRGDVPQQNESQTLQTYRTDTQLLDSKTFQLITGTSH